MAIRYEDIRFEDKGGGGKPTKKEVSEKANMAEEPNPTEIPGELPFGKPTSPEKKARKPKR